MAFSFQDNQNNKNLFNIIGLVVFILLLLLGTYLLFFAPEPFVEVIAPSGVESLSDLAEIELNETPLAEDPVYQKLEIKVKEVELGEAGRDNPFGGF